MQSPDEHSTAKNKQTDSRQTHSQLADVQNTKQHFQEFWQIIEASVSTMLQY